LITAIPNTKTAIARKSLLIFSGKVLPVLILFIITILYSRKLSYDDYGRFQSVWMYANIVNVIITFGFTSLLLSSNLQFLFSFISRNRSKVIIFYSALIITVFLAFFYYSKGFTTGTMYILLLFILVQNLATISETLLIKNHKERPAFIINLIYSLLFFGWHLYILEEGFDLGKLIWGIIIISAAKCVAMFAIPYKLAEQKGNTESDSTFQKHWIYLGMNDIVGTISKWLDKVFLLYLLTAGDFAIYFNGSFEIPLFGLLISVAGSLLLIEISASKSSTEKIMYSFNNTYRILSAIVFPLFLFLLFYHNELFATVFKNRYNASIPIFLISIMILPLRINNYSALLQCYSKGNIIMAGSVIDICLSMILMLVLYPVMGTKGIALAVVIATWCQVIYYLWQSAKVMKVSFLNLLPIGYLLINFLVLGLAFAPVYFLTANSGIWEKLIVGALLTTIAVIAGVAYFYKKKLIIT
jgi:O-antigen/teichoic acid export membrane protein